MGDDCVITRFAPSPTGDLHIGGARTALFNWLYARKMRGKFLLRIEDTDRSRSSDDMVSGIYNSLDWLGLHWDGDAVSQYSRREVHKSEALRLVELGLAYKCYESPESIILRREQAKAEGRSFCFRSEWRDGARNIHDAEGEYVVRLRVPDDHAEEHTVISDVLQGEVTWNHSDLDDFVLLRSDGSPTYMLAVVVDDHNMGVTHVIRGDDHLTNAARQSLLYRALGWRLPKYVHIPMILGADGARLSKRYGATGVLQYKSEGYLPEALCNYLCRLGWSHDNDEIFSMEEAIEWFSFDGLGKSPSRFDLSKLNHLNATYMRSVSHDRILSLFSDFCDLKGYHISDAVMDMFRKSLKDLLVRARNLDDLYNSTYYLRASVPLQIEEKASQLLTGSNLELITECFADLLSVENWTEADIERRMREFATIKDLSLGKLAQPVRVALTGSTSSPGIFSVMDVLGKDECMVRVMDITGTNICNFVNDSKL